MQDKLKDKKKPKQAIALEYNPDEGKGAACGENYRKGKRN